MQICGIYKITSPSKKVYIGQSTNILHRFSSYKGLHCKSQKKLLHSFKRYGIDKHLFEILCQCDESELNNLEIYYIQLYQCYNSKYGLNLTEGGKHTSGNKGNRLSEESKLKMRMAKLGVKRKPFTEITKQKMRKPKSEQGRKNMKGRIQTKETREKIGKAHRGKVTSEIAKQKMSIAHKGKVVSIETKNKISETFKSKRINKK